VPYGQVVLADSSSKGAKQRYGDNKQLMSEQKRRWRKGLMLLILSLETLVQSIATAFAFCTCLMDHLIGIHDILNYEKLALEFMA